MLRYTGHPLVDVGVATITVWSRRQRPEEVTVEDLGKMAEYLEGLLLSKTTAKMYLLFNYSNVPFANPGQQSDAHSETRSAYARHVLRGFEASETGPASCVFCGRPAYSIASRGQVPLLSGEGVINFGPGGVPGVPICGCCQLALHAAPLGGRKSEGSVLLILADQARAMQSFAAQALRDNLRYLSMVSDGGFNWPNESFPRTRLIEALQDARQRIEGWEQVRTLVGYQVTNYGPKPGVSIYSLPSAAVDLIREVTHPAYPARPAWQLAVNRAWEKRKKKGEDSTDETFRRNFLFEDLFDLPDKARQFVRRYLIPPQRRLEDWTDLPSGSFDLLVLFFGKVMEMRSSRVEAIRVLGDRLALYIRQHDRRLFNDLHFARKYPDLRLALLRAAREGWSPDDAPLLPLDTFVSVFEEGDNDYADLDWRLARDVLMIRVCEQLQEAGWFTHNREYIETLDPETEEKEEN